MGSEQYIEYKNCTLCPRKCRADRSKTKGYCKAGDKIKIARAGLHIWEEPCISGRQGSGAIFFSGCNMGCVFCQNKEISSGATGKEISDDRLTEIFFELKDKGANNINLVTAGLAKIGALPFADGRLLLCHNVAKIAFLNDTAKKRAKKMGLR